MGDDDNRPIVVLPWDLLDPPLTEDEYAILKSRLEENVFTGHRVMVAEGYRGPVLIVDSNGNTIRSV